MLACISATYSDQQLYRDKINAIFDDCERYARDVIRVVDEDTRDTLQRYQMTRDDHATPSTELFAPNLDVDGFTEQQERRIKYVVACMNKILMEHETALLRKPCAQNLRQFAKFADRQISNMALC